MFYTNDIEYWIIITGLTLISRNIELQSKDIALLDIFTHMQMCINVCEVSFSILWMEPVIAL